MNENSTALQHAALWLIGPDVPGLLRMGSKFVADRGGNIDKDIGALKKETHCGVVFQPMRNPTVPEGFENDLYGFDILTEDRPGIIAELTSLVAQHRMMIVGHTGERHIEPGPLKRVVGGQKFVVMLPHGFDHEAFTHDLNLLVKENNGKMVTPLRTVPGLLWSW